MHMHFFFVGTGERPSSVYFNTSKKRKKPTCGSPATDVSGVHFFHVNSLPSNHTLTYTGAHHFYCFHCQRRGRRLRKYFQRSTFESEIRTTQIYREKDILLWMGRCTHTSGSLAAKGKSYIIKHQRHSKHYLVTAFVLSGVLSKSPEALLESLDFWWTHRVCWKRVREFRTLWECACIPKDQHTNAARGRDKGITIISSRADVCLPYRWNGSARTHIICHATFCATLLSLDPQESVRVHTWIPKVALKCIIICMSGLCLVRVLVNLIIGAFPICFEIRDFPAESCFVCCCRVAPSVLGLWESQELWVYIYYYLFIASMDGLDLLFTSSL